MRANGDDDAIRDAAWVASYVGRREVAPLTESDVTALAEHLSEKPLQPGSVLFRAGENFPGVCMVRSGLLELVVGTGQNRAVVQFLRPGDVDGDIHLLQQVPALYTARAVEESVCLVLAAEAFTRLLTEHPSIAYRWLSSIATRLTRSHRRILELVGKSLSQQIARLLLDEAVEDVVALPQRTLAAMLGVRRPSINRVLKALENEDLVELRYGEVKLRDADGVQRIATAR